ncbi:tetratricopeptide repeat protein [Kitasatospora aureofaciens]|uniref:tetratricopeptide repeat protein n=1 Tax=Kitasatospora aureofaciens TaxID=1894 RepID=UPI0037C78231
MALTGARCQWPGCGRPLAAPVDDEPVLDGEIAHIRASRPGGKRHDPGWTREQLNGFGNLLLLCAPHHKAIDGRRADNYSVAELEGWKHEYAAVMNDFWRRAPDAGSTQLPAPPAAWRSWPTVAELDPPAAGVHPGWPHRGDALPQYVPRDLDPQLADLLAQAGARGGLVLVAGDTASGKSRLAHEASRRALPDHLVRLAPRGGLREAIAAVLRCPKPCILWLDYLERHTGSDRLRSQDVAELRRCRIPILATVHTRHFPAPATHPHRDDGRTTEPVLSQAVLDQAATVFLARSWSAPELARARATDDPRIRSAVDNCTHGGVSEFLAAGPALWATWQAAWRIGGNPTAAALVRSAVDLRRAGLPGPLPTDLLTRAHRYYLADAGADLLRPEPLDAAFSWARESRIGMTSLLQPAADGAHLLCPALLDGAPRSEPAIHPLLWFEALGSAPDLTTTLTVVSNAEREHPSITPWLWRCLREAGLTRAVWGEAFALIRQGRPEDALDVLREHTERDDPLARRFTALALKELGRLDEAQAACREAHALGNPDGLVDLAQILAERGRLDEAENALRRAARAGATNAWFNLGVLLADRGKTRPAIRAYRKAVAAGDLDALGNLGGLLADTGQTHEAEAVLRRAVERGNREAELELANVLKYLHRTDEAQQLYERLIDHGDARARTNLGNLHAANDRPEQAEQAYRAALDAGLPVAHEYLGRHLAGQERWHDAVPHLRHAVEQGAPGAGLRLGHALQQEGRTEAAKDAYRDAARAGDPLGAVGFACLADETEADERRLLLQQAVDAGSPDAMLVVMVELDHSGHPREAEALRRRIAACGDPLVSGLLATYAPVS